MFNTTFIMKKLDKKTFILPSHMAQKLHSLYVCVCSVLNGLVLSCVSLAKLCVHVSST